MVSLGMTDRLLRRYCRTADPRALSRVFDRTAHELLRSAIWLAGNRTDAEDILQRTFLTVIECRQSYDPGRRALPWLLGILGNHARKLRAERYRRQQCAVAAPAAAWPVEDPAAVAAEAELDAILSRLRGELASPYREVLDLHLGRGLSTPEIAARLSRRPATVRTQLARGLALLRERIPLSLVPVVAAAALLPGAATASRLAAIRAEVVGEAAAAAPLATASIASKSKAALAAAIAICVGSLAVWSASRGDPAPAGGQPSSPVAAVAAVEPAAERPGSARVDAAVATAVPSPVAAAAAAGYRVRGRAIHEDGRPAAHATLWLSAEDDWRRGAPCGSCDAGGRFELALRGRRYLGIRLPGHTASYLHLCDGDSTRELELRLRGAGGVVRGRVFGSTGAPLAGARVAIGPRGGWRVSTSNPGLRLHPPRAVAQTAADGRFELDGLEPGTTDIVATARRHGPWRGTVAVRLRPAGDLILRLRPGAVIRGVVRDADNRPAAGVAVAVVGSDDAPTGAVTGADGHYELRDLPAGELQLLASSESGRAACTRRLVAGEQATWSPVLASPPVLTGAVRAGDGRPLSGLRVHADDGRFATTGRDGRFALPVASAASLAVTVRRGHTLLAHRTGLRPGAAPVTLTLSDGELPTARIAGRVVTADGTPVFGLIIVRNHRFELAWSEATDPATGAFAIGPTPPGDYTLIVEAEGHGRAPVRVLGLQSGETRALSPLVMPRAGRVEVVLRSRDVEPREVIQFARTDGIVVAHAMTEGARVTAELLPGDYVASVWSGACAGSAVPVTVRSGETVRCDLPCAPTARVGLTLLRPGALDSARIDVSVTDPSGNFFNTKEVYAGPMAIERAVIGLPLGSYRITARTVDGRSATAALTIASADAPPQLRLDLR